MDQSDPTADDHAEGKAMGAATDPPDDDIDRALAYVCQRLDYLRDLLRPDRANGDDSPELRALTDAVIAARSPDRGELHNLLQVLHQAVQGAGDQLGVWDASAATWKASTERRSLHLPGLSTGIPFETIYRCPLGRCTGRRPDHTTLFPLICRITGRELQRTAL